jgi:isopenicillin N synthase-like dioxygenase
LSAPTFSYDALISGGYVLKALDDVCADLGIFLLSDAPISESLVRDCHRVTAAFFALGAQEKEKYRSPTGDQFTGWCGPDNRNELGTSDFKEMYHIGPRVAPSLPAHQADGRVPTVGDDVAAQALAACPLWPDELVEFIVVWHQYYAAMQALAVAMSRVFAAALHVSPTPWLALLANNFADMAANFYPAPTTAQQRGQVRNAVHSDFTLFTILWQDPTAGAGLTAQDRSGSWIDLDPVPETFVVNVGELLAYLTQERWRPVPHQVRPAADGTSATDRISIPFFYRPNDATTIAPLTPAEGVPPLAIGEWVARRKARVGTAA